MMSSSVCLLRLLRSQGPTAEHLNTAFVGLIISRLTYALPAWGMFVSAGRASRIDAFLKRSHKWGFCKDRATLNELVNKSGLSLFQKIQSPMHCLNLLLSSKKLTTIFKYRLQLCSTTMSTKYFQALFY